MTYKTRCFLVFYHFSAADKTGNGCVDVLSHDGGYVNHDNCIKRIKIILHELQYLRPVNVTISNIIELTQSDYADFYKKGN